MQELVATLGKNSLAFSSGASSRYEISGDRVSLTGDPVSGIYRIESDRPVGDRFTFVPRDPNDTSPVDLWVHGE